MTPAEIAISLVGVVAGYWLVSRFMEGSKPAPSGDGSHDRSPPEQPEHTARSAAEEPVTLANWHLVLGVPQTADKDEIAQAYRRQISQYHPDKVAQMGAEIRALALAKSQQINAAYEIGTRLAGGDRA